MLKCLVYILLVGLLDGELTTPRQISAAYSFFPNLFISGNRACAVVIL
jgi:hypothetical protein